MIHLTRINRVPLVLNSDLIEHIESPEEIISRVTQFRRDVLGQPFPVGRSGSARVAFRAEEPRLAADREPE